MAIFVDDEIYTEETEAIARLINKIGTGALMKALAYVEPCAFTGELTADQLKHALGEHADVWSRSIMTAGDEIATVLPFRRRG